MEEDCSCLIYLQTDASLYLLKILEDRSQDLLRIENYYYPQALPPRIKLMTCDNKLFLVGGAPRSEIYSCSHSDSPDENGFYFIISPSEFPRMHGPKVDPIVVMLENKVYVLSTSYHSYAEEHRPALFEVYNPVTKVWTVLPNPPFLYVSMGYKDLEVFHYIWGSKIVVFSVLRLNAYMFDTIREAWEPATKILLGFAGFLEFKEYRIGISCFDFLELVAFKDVDENDMPKHRQVLFNLHDLFGVEFFEPISVTPIDDKGGICILLGGHIEWVKKQACVCKLVFKLSTPEEGISADLVSTQKFSVEFTSSPKISTIAM